MKFSCEKSLFEQTINTVIRAVPAKSSVPAMEGILLEAEGETVTATAYNGQTAIRTRIDVDVEREGRIVLGAKLLSEIVRKMPDGTVTLDSAEDGATKLNCGNARYNVSSLSADDFPELPEVETENALEIRESALGSMIAQTVFAVSANEARPVQTGELFEAANGKLNVVACDGFRLAARKEPMERGADMEFVVPGAALSEVERLCGATDDTVRIAVGNRHVLFTIGGAELISRRLDGAFLDWKKAVPRDNPINVKVDAKALMQSIERVGVVINEKMKSPIRCAVGMNEITLSARTGIGAATDRCKVDGDGGDLEIGFNHRYLSDALRYAPENALNVSFKSSTTPAVITAAAGDNGGKFLYMVLPVRLKAE